MNQAVETASGAPVREGEVLAGKYRVERVLGAGGMGVVVAATHLQLESRVALKFLTKEAMENGEAVARFAREARAAVRIKSEHVARVIDVGTLETGAPYMVMEYLEGEDLARVLEARGPLPVGDAVEYVLHACEAIAHAHVLGIVHRDLKPANLFLIRRPDGLLAIKVLDFGISKIMPGKGSSSDDAMTRTRAVLGSPIYMSPEQMTSTRDVDGRTDVWALGVILYELVAGKPPFSADSMPQLCGLILAGPTPSIREVCPSAPPALDAVLQRCLEKDPARRYANVAEFAAELAELAPKRARASVDHVSRIVRAAGGATGSVLGATSAFAAASTGGSWAGTKRPAADKKGRAAWFAGAAVALAVAAGGLAASRLFSPSRTAGPPAVTAGSHEPPASPPSAAPAEALPLVAPPLVENTIAAPAEAGASPDLPPEPASSRAVTLREPAPPAAARPAPIHAPAKRPTPRAAPSPSSAPAAPRPVGDLFDDRK